MEFTLEDIRCTMKDVIDSHEKKATLTISECCRFTGIGRDKLMELAHSENSDFPCFKVGCRFLINREKLLEWLDRITDEGRTL